MLTERFIGLGQGLGKEHDKGSAFNPRPICGFPIHTLPSTRTFFLAPITTRNTARTDAVSRRAASTLGAGRSGKFGRACRDGHTFPKTPR